MLQITQKLLNVNFTKGRAQFRPEIIVVHITDGPDGSAEQAFQDPTYEKSAHYLIKKDGSCLQLVLDEDTAWTQGIVNNPISKYVLEHKGINPNLYCLGIETEAQNEDANEIQYNALAELIILLSKKFLIPLDRNHIIGHYEIRIDKVCPWPISVDKVLNIAKRINEIPPKLEIIKKQVSILSEIVALLIKIKNLSMFNSLKKFGADGESYPALLASSVDSHKISATIKSLAVLVPFIVLTAKFFHLDLGEGELNEILELASSTILAVGTAFSAGATLFFAARKILVKLNIY